MIGLNRRRTMGVTADEIIMTIESNPEMLAICYSRGWCASDQYMTASEAASVTSFERLTYNNTVTHFEEFEYFTGVTQIPINCFRGMTNLKRIVFPESLVWARDYSVFQTGLEEIDTRNITTIDAQSTFALSPSLKKLIIGKNLTSKIYPNPAASLEQIVVDIANTYFSTNGTALVYESNKELLALAIGGVIPTDVEIIGVGSIRSRVFSDLNIPSSVNTFGANIFYQTTITNLIVNATVPPTIESNSFSASRITNIYVPDTSVEAYKTAWSGQSSKIKPISSFNS